MHCVMVLQGVIFNGTSALLLKSVKQSVSKVFASAASAFMGAWDVLWIVGELSDLLWGLVLRRAAPEVLEGKRATVKADIFSFGVVLWEVITGETPERGRYGPVK